MGIKTLREWLNFLGGVDRIQNIYKNSNLLETKTYAPQFATATSEGGDMSGRIFISCDGEAVLVFKSVDGSKEKFYLSVKDGFLSLAWSM